MNVIKSTCCGSGTFFMHSFQKKKKERKKTRPQTQHGCCFNKYESVCCHPAWRRKARLHIQGYLCYVTHFPKAFHISKLKCRRCCCHPSTDLILDAPGWGLLLRWYGLQSIFAKGHLNRRGKDGLKSTRTAAVWGFSFCGPNQASGLKCENRPAAILRGEKCVVTLLAESVQLKSAMLSTDRLQTKESQVPANFGSLLRLLDNRCLSFKLA